MEPHMPCEPTYYLSRGHMAEKFAEFGRPDLSAKLLALVPRVEALTYEDFTTTASKQRKPASRTRAKASTVSRSGYRTTMKRRRR